MVSQLIVRLETRAPGDKWSLIDLQVRVKITSGNAKTAASVLLSLDRSIGLERKFRKMLNRIHVLWSAASSLAVNSKCILTVFLVRNNGLLCTGRRSEKGLPKRPELG